MAQITNELNKEWKPAIYARLSDEDKENKVNGVSLSIDNQINILKKFVKDKGWQEAKVFFDDNRTGTDFNRKGFQDMYAEAQNGNINVIVIKDAYVKHTLNIQKIWVCQLKCVSNF